LSWPVDDEEQNPVGAVVFPRRWWCPVPDGGR
jgi:hypothetical protein